MLNAAYRKGMDLFSVEEMCVQLEKRVAEMYSRYPQNRIRLKAIGGGGGKGQRILASPESFDGKTLEQRIAKAAARAPERAREILAEVKATGVGDNKNILIELNIETTRHQEIQVIGNGVWATTLGGRDCSLQMHEQKLLEVSVTEEELELAIERAEAGGRAEEAKVLESDLAILRRMEDEAARFGAAVGLDSVSTFECIVERDHHFFMEMNTRIQVEHRVTELCYGLRFTNPDDARDSFVVESLVEAMVLLARHKTRLPKPERVHRNNASVEARLNATNQALHPHAGGIIRNWSNAIEGEIRDDQGISLHNPDTDVFMAYTLAGAYDSNIALAAHGRQRPPRQLPAPRRDPARHATLGQGSRDQPRVPLRPGELVHRRQHQCAPDHALHPAVPHGGGAAAREGGTHRPRSRAGAAAQAPPGGGRRTPASARPWPSASTASRRCCCARSRSSSPSRTCSPAGSAAGATASPSPMAG